nr:hypothetical protein [uncultured Campylobacter sp.]
MSGIFVVYLAKFINLTFSWRGSRRAKDVNLTYIKSELEFDKFDGG